jgi:hypothetical protein
VATLVRVTATEWVEGLQARIQEFSRTRSSPVVEVHLAFSHVVLRVKRADAGPGDSQVTFDVFPDAEPGPAILDAMVRRDPDGELYTPRQVIVRLDRIDRVELLHDLPRATSIGFQAPDE